MTDWGQANVTGRPALLVQAGSSPALLNNTDANNTVWLLDDQFALDSGDLTNASPLGPLGSVVFDGKRSVWGVCTSGQTALVSRYPGGLNFFQVLELLVKTLLITATAGNGEYVYDSAPAAGHLIASIVSTAAADPEGNATLAGFTSYLKRLAAPPGYTIANLFAGALTFLTGGSEAGPYGVQSGISLAVNSVVGVPPRVLSIGQGVAGSTVQIVDPVWQRIPVADPVTPSQAETWHVLPLAAGWTAGNPAPQYRLMPDGQVLFIGQATNSTAFTVDTALSASAIPSAYWPTFEVDLATGYRSGSAGKGGIIINGTGNVFGSPYQNSASTTTIYGVGTYPTF